MLPTFIGIGAQRAGTTWIYNCLKQHPDIFMSEPKELHFFYVNYYHGIKWYEDHFNSCGNAKAIGEITPDYMYRETAMANMAKHLPNAKLFMVLRNPIERTISAYRLFNKKFRNMSFHDALLNDPVLIEQSRYINHIKMVYKYYDKSQIKILIYDDLENDPLGFIRELYNYLDVDTTFEPEGINVRYNRIIYPKMQELLIKYKLEWLIETVKALPLGKWIRKKHEKQGIGKGSDILESDIVKLKMTFKSDIHALSKMIDIDLSNWYS